MKTTRFLLVAFGVCLAIPAWAQEGGARQGSAQQEQVDISPTYATLTRFDEHHRGDFDFGLQFFTDDAGGGWAWRADVHVQYAVGDWGYYGSTMMASFNPEGPGSTGGLGSLEGGAYHLSRTASGLLVLRGGLQLPTAADGLGFFGNVQTIYQRIVDFSTVFPDALTPRASASLIGTSGALEYRVEGGVDFIIPINDETIEDPELLVNASAGVGTRSGNLFYSGEIANTAIVTEDTDELGDRFLHSLAFQVKHLGPYAHLSATFITPLDTTDFGPSLGNAFLFIFGAEIVKLP